MLPVSPLVRSHTIVAEEPEYPTPINAELHEHPSRLSAIRPAFNIRVVVPAVSDLNVME